MKPNHPNGNPPLPVELTHRAARSTKLANKILEDYMKIRLILLCTLSALLWSFAARAQETVDAAKITCNQFMLGRIANSGTISIWLIS
jgi:hypothetical protein